MRQRIVLGAGLALVATAAGIITLSHSSGQPPQTPPESGPVKQASYDAPAATAEVSSVDDRQQRNSGLPVPPARPPRPWDRPAPTPVDPAVQREPAHRP